ncbi:hypothetical protein ACS0PU_007181 [Formica fusca]
MVVVVENDEEVEGQRRTKKKEEEEDHVILLWYTSSVPGSDVPLTWHTLQLASLQDPEEWVCLSYGSDRASLAVYYPRVPISTRNSCDRSGDSTADTFLAIYVTINSNFKALPELFRVF